MQGEKQLECLIPILNVSDLGASMAYWTDELGFRKSWDWGDPPDFGCVERDGIEIFFCEGGQGRAGTWMTVFVRDVDALYAELTERGAEISLPIRDEPWNVREFHVRDPDGHTIRFSMGIESA